MEKALKAHHQPPEPNPQIYIVKKGVEESRPIPQPQPHLETAADRQVLSFVRPITKETFTLKDNITSSHWVAEREKQGSVNAQQSLGKEQNKYLWPSQSMINTTGLSKYSPSVTEEGDLARYHTVTQNQRTKNNTHLYSAPFLSTLFFRLLLLEYPQNQLHKHGDGRHFCKLLNVLQSIIRLG